MLVERGRLSVSAPAAVWVEAMVQALPRHCPGTAQARAAIHACHCNREPAIGLSHQDPADRFLAATAQVLALTLVAADARRLHSTQYAVLAND